MYAKKNIANLALTSTLLIYSCMHAKNNTIIQVGCQWGDEGKGKVIDLLAQSADVVVRAQGGNNAGHTVVIGKEEYVQHLIPSGIMNEQTICYLGGGLVLDPEVLLKEIDDLEKRNIKISGRLFISPYAHVIMPYHKILDEEIEKAKGKDAIGTTKRGIGPSLSDKVHRTGIRIIDFINPELLKKNLVLNLKLVNEQLIKIYGNKEIEFNSLYKKEISLANRLKPYVSETVEVNINKAISEEKNVLFEGTQGAMLDSTYGTYPFVTSSCTLAAGVCAGSGVGPTKINHTLGIMKAYTSRVGNGPFPTQVPKEEMFLDLITAGEVGNTTGRMHRIGWFDGPVSMTSVMLNGADSIALMKLDILDDLETIKICTKYKYNDKVYDVIPGECPDISLVTPIYEEVAGWQTKTSGITSYEELPENMKLYIKKIEESCKVPVSIISVGPGRNQTIFVPKNKLPFTPSKNAVSN